MLDRQRFNGMAAVMVNGSHAAQNTASSRRPVVTGRTAGSATIPVRGSEPVEIIFEIHLTK